MTKLSPGAMQCLKEAYDSFNHSCSCKEYPLVLSISKKKSNDRARILRESAIDANYIRIETRNELVDNGLVQPIKNSSLLALTAKGVWTIESHDNGLSIDDLLKGINDIYYGGFDNITIGSRNKIVLFTMIAMRTYSKNTPVDVRMEKNVSENWWEIFLAVNDFLVEMGVVANKDSLRTNKKEKSGIESPASDLIRHSDKLPKFTNDVFVPSGKNQYWLDILDGDHIDVDKLSYLIKQTLGDNIDFINASKYSSFANELCMDYSYKVESSYSDNKYQSCQYDVEIKQAFDEATKIVIN